MNFPNFSPPAPGAINIRTFPDLRRFLITYIVNQWQQYVNNYWQNDVLPLLNTSTFGYGPDLPAATSVSPVGLVQLITGSAVISTLNPFATPGGNFAGPFFAIARDGFSTNTSGNILLAVNVPAGHTAIFAYHPVIGKWGVITS